MMSFESAFTLLAFLSTISAIMLSANALSLDTTLYDYHLLQDVIEVFEKKGTMEKLSKYHDPLYSLEKDLLKEEILNDMDTVKSLTGRCMQINDIENCNASLVPATSEKRILPLTFGFTDVQFTLGHEI